MERNTKTTVYNLQIGDRFYKCNDKKKTILEKVEHSIKQTHFQTYRHWSMEAKYMGRVITAEQIEKYAKPIKSDTEVIFLRHKNDTND